MRKDIKVVFMGTPEFAKCSLESLVESGYNVVGCFTNPDRPSGRGMKMKMSEVKEYAISKDIPVYQPLKVRKNEEVMDTLKELKPDVIAVVAYGKILPKEILDFPRLGSINVHGSLLPKYRGAAPIQWSIINGENVTGITTMFMDIGMDTGDMLLKEEVVIEDEDNYETLHDKLKIVGANLLVKTIDGVVDGSITRTPQPEEGTMAPMIDRQMTKINFEKGGREIFNFVRGLSPFPGTQIELNEKIFKVYNVKYIITDEYDNIQDGEIASSGKDHLYIKCKDGYISILEIQPQNSKRMGIQAFMAGGKL